MKTKNYQELLRKLQNQIPFIVFSTKYLSQSLHEKGISTNEKRGFEVSEVEDSKEFGGIICHIKPENSDNVLVISLTHLRVNQDFPLRKEIMQYKRQRIKEISNAYSKI